MSVEIKALYEVPDCAPILAFWSYMEWYIDRPVEFDLVLLSYKMRAKDHSIPLSFVAVKDSLPVGMVSPLLNWSNGWSIRGWRFWAFTVS